MEIPNQQPKVGISSIKIEMAKPSQDDLTRVLSDAGSAHHEYEQVDLKGKRDEQWAAFYSAHALGRLVDLATPGTLSK